MRRELDNGSPFCTEHLLCDTHCRFRNKCRHYQDATCLADQLDSTDALSAVCEVTRLEHEVIGNSIIALVKDHEGSLREVCFSELTVGPDLNCYTQTIQKALQLREVSVHLGLKVLVWNQEYEMSPTTSGHVAADLLARKGFAAARRCFHNHTLFGLHVVVVEDTAGHVNLVPVKLEIIATCRIVELPECLPCHQICFS